MPEFTVIISDENLARANSATQTIHNVNLKQFVIERVRKMVSEFEKGQAAYIAEQGVVLPDDFIEITQ